MCLDVDTWSRLFIRLKLCIGLLSFVTVYEIPMVSSYKDHGSWINWLSSSKAARLSWTRIHQWIYLLKQHPEFNVTKCIENLFRYANPQTYCTSTTSNELPQAIWISWTQVSSVALHSNDILTTKFSIPTNSELIANRTILGVKKLALG